jgi:hypothetical protein
MSHRRLLDLIALCKRHRREIESSVSQWRIVIRSLEQIGKMTGSRLEKFIELRDACKFFRGQCKEPERWTEIIGHLEFLIKFEKRRRASLE